ncbi:hypothetical protein [uncultured Thiothrix sp.]|mgnify:FL=1|uniref:hypothetical protein n=1 Tax=uncultured Thiothrix sp. TaxID=223185 RepID=UPI00260EED00|nr:hypothetical protein [uncultured Thiothrix sp.]HMT92999.1 hypothetical protein [Thiolinea sp.]
MFIQRFTNQLILFAGLAFAPVVFAADLVPTKVEYQHAEEAGGKGSDVIKLTAPKACAVFDDARIVYTKRRYGQANIVSKPASGCNPAGGQCKLEVKWEHEPAGRLNYQVEINWKLQSSC